MEADSKLYGYLLSYSKSWEPHDKISDTSLYSNSLLKGRNQIKIEEVCSTGSVYNTNIV